jgi:ATP-binding cassette subfamily B protein
MTTSLKRQVYTALLPYWGMIGVALVQVVLISSAELLRPWPLKLIIDHVLNGQPLNWPLVSNWSCETLLVVACVGLVCIHIVLGGLNMLHNDTTSRIGHGVVNDLRAMLFSHLQCLPLAFHHRHQVGDLLYRVTTDTNAIKTLTINGLFPILTSLVLLVGMTLILLRLDWVLTLLSLGVCPLLFVLLSVFNPRIDAAATTARERESALYSLAQQTMAAIRIIQAFTREKEEHRRFMGASSESLAANLRLSRLVALYSGLVNVITAIGTAVVVWVGAHHVLAGPLSVGELVVFTAYLASLYGPLSTISRTLGLIEEAKVSLKRAHEIFATVHNLPQGKRMATKIRGEVTFTQVSFAYSCDRPVLHRVNLHVTPGQTVAIIGPTGAGKSTLMGLLARFFDPQEGQVLLDGTDVREFTLASLRRQIAMVLQPSMVLPGTIRENIAYGRPHAPPIAVQRAAQMAHIHDKIMRLPQGYDTVIGEQGATLSEGERQRLTIARALVCDAPILVLDEPTSSVDAETESLIMEGLGQLTQGRTTFIIAHRLSTVRRADVIVVMQQGQIVEQGSFAELIDRQGPFAALYRAQFSVQKQSWRKAA